jgi:uncharacterized membrane protein YhaH (DUF805 family)
MSNAEIRFWSTLLSARGRNNRARYWQVIGLCWFGLVVCGLILAASESAGVVVEILVGVVAVLAILVLCVAGVLNTIKRLHDLGRSGWWLLLVIGLDLPLALIADGPPDSGLQVIGALLQALYSLALLAAFGAWPGQRGANRFGEPPGRPGEAVVTEQAA